MRDCVLKTNDYTELAPFINANYNDNLLDHIHYYDAWEDKTYKAIMEEYENEEEEIVEEKPQKKGFFDKFF
jgi:hypothetical protein